MQQTRSYFPQRKTPGEQKQIRMVLGLVLGLTLVLILLATCYREFPKWWQKINQPKLVASERLTPTRPTATPTPRFTEQKKSIESILLPLRGKYGIFYEDIGSKNSFGINEKEVFTAASLIKMPVLITLYREAEIGNINLDEVYKLQASDKREGAGALQNKPVGFEISYRKIAELMGKQSDNTAFNVVANKLGTEKIQNTINALGMKNTSYAENLTSPVEMGLLFRKLYLEKIISDKNRDEILSFITDTIWEDRIPVGVPEGINVSHKIGTEVGVISDAGIVFGPKPFILVIMSQEVNEIEARKALPEITKKIYEMTQGLDTKERE